MSDDFFSGMRNVAKQRREERYAANRQLIVDHFNEGDYKLLDNIKSALIRVTKEKSAIFYLTLNKWKYNGQYFLGTPHDFILWLRKQQRGLDK